MGLTTEHRGRGPTVFVPGTGQFLNSTCIRTNQSRKSIIYSAILQSRRDFRRGNYKEIRKSLELIGGNDKMNNKTATECWDILRG